MADDNEDEARLAYAGIFVDDSDEDLIDIQPRVAQLIKKQFTSCFNSLQVSLIESVTAAVVADTRTCIASSIKSAIAGCVIPLETKIGALQDELNNIGRTIMQQMEKLNGRVTELEHDISSLKTKFSAFKSGPSPCHDMVESFLSIMEERDEQKSRACNIMISGLPADKTVSDEELVGNIFEKHLTLPPTTCQIHRVGNNPASKIKVTLPDEKTANTILRASRRLKNSKDIAIQNVFIGRDLTTRQAALAFKKRTERRLTAGVTTQRGRAAHSKAPHEESFCNQSFLE